MSTRKDLDPIMDVTRHVMDEAVHLLIQNLPAMKEVSLELMDTVFCPTIVAKQLALAVALQLGSVTAQQIVALCRMLLSHTSSQRRLVRQLRLEQAKSETQDEWMDLAERIDQITGDEIWRREEECPLYERSRIQSRIDELVHLMRRRDVFELMFTLRGGLARNKFGLLHEGLFSRALAGSKVLVETYHNVVCAALDMVCDAPVVLPEEEPIPTDARLAFFNEVRHSYGRTALLLSGGAALGFYHVGVVKTLLENGLMPRVLGGSSAGSIVCALIGTRTDDECMNDLFQVQGTNAPGHSGQLNFTFFSPVKKNKKNQQQLNGQPTPVKSEGGAIAEVFNNTAGAFQDAKRTWQLLMPIGIRHLTNLIWDVVTFQKRPQDMLAHDTDYFRQVLKTNVGNFTFQEAFDRTGRILNITVTPKNSSDPPRLLNYLTAPHVLVWSAAVASSSLPGVFEANKLVVKDADGTERFESAEPSAHFSDGSMEQDLPMQQLSEMFNVNHFIVSQANPHAVMFASFGLDTAVWSSPMMGMLTQVLLFLKNQVRGWFKNFVDLLGARRIAPLFETRRGMWQQFFTQEYEGRPIDISLIPWISHQSFFSALLHCIYNPSEDDVRSWIAAAERETWKYIPAIKSHIAEEVTLDRCVQRLRRRIFAESWGRQQAGNKETMGNKIPSFFTSPSLVNMSGLGVGDRTNLSGGDLRGVDHQQVDSAQFEYDEKARAGLVPVEFGPGWQGMGLRGNHSSGSLVRSMSGGSGLFYDDEHYQQQAEQEQVAGEHPISPSQGGTAVSTEAPSGYLKTSSMAQFYYRRDRNASHEDFSKKFSPMMPMSQSQGHLTPPDEKEQEDGLRDDMTRPPQSQSDLTVTKEVVEATPLQRNNRKTANKLHSLASSN